MNAIDDENRDSFPVAMLLGWTVNAIFLVVNFLLLLARMA